MALVTDAKNMRSSPSQTTKMDADEIYRNKPPHTTSNVHSEHEVTLNTYSQLSEVKWTDALSFYETFMHTGDVREGHKKVIDIQNRLLEAQQRRIDIMTELTIARREQQIIQDELANCTRSQDRYLGLVRKEIDARKAEEAKQQEFHTADQHERNLFTHLTSAVSASHEKEKIYSNTIRIWSIILTILGGVVGMIGTSLTYYYRQTALKGEMGELALEMKWLRNSLNNSTSKSPTAESWGSFIGRKSKDVYGFFWRW